MPSTTLLDACGRRRSPATLSSFHQGLPPLNKGQRYPADPPSVEEIIAVMHASGDDHEGVRLRQAFVPRMLTQGQPASVVNTASMAGIVPTAKMAPYCASKFGVVGLSEALNAELSPRGIHVSAICPGIIDTPIVATGIMRGDIAALHEQATRFYSKRGASPDEVAQAILQTIAKHKLIVPVPRRQVTLPYVLHRLSPQLTPPIARGFERIISHG